MTATHDLYDSLWKLVLQNEAWSTIGAGIAAAVTPGSLWFSLHTTTPGAAADQTTNEASYSGYARVPITRSTSFWTFRVSADRYWAYHTGSLGSAEAITFAPNYSGGELQFLSFGLGTASAGAGHLIWYSQNVTTGALIVADGYEPVITRYNLLGR